jgi:crystallin alpha B
MAFSERERLLRDWYGPAATERVRQPFSRLFDQHFGLNLTDEDILLPSAFFPQSRPRRLFTRQQSGVSEVNVEKERFQVMLDVQQFRPREISVKVVNGFIVVEGKHEEREDEHGFISREFKRRYALPEDVKAENVESNLSSDGVLLLSAPRSTKESEPAERTVFVHQTGRPAMNTKKEQPASSTESSSKPESTATGNAPTENSTGEKSAAGEGRKIDIQLSA